MDERCRATNAAGSPCSARPVLASGYCWWHCPRVAAQRAEARRRGGEERSSKKRAKKELPTELLSADELLAYCTVAFKAVLGGKMDPKVGNSVITIAKGMVEIRNAGAVDDLAAEVAELKATVNRSGAA